MMSREHSIALTMFKTECPLSQEVLGDMRCERMEADTTPGNLQGYLDSNHIPTLCCSLVVVA